MSHTLVVGASGSGKTTAQLHAVDHESWFLILDWHDEFAQASGDCMSAKGIKFVYSDLSKRPVPLRFLRRSNIRKENEETARMFSEVIATLQGREDLRRTPLVEKYALSGVQLWLNQRNDIPQSWLKDSLDVQSDKFAYMLQHCTCDETRASLQRVMGMSSRDQHIELGGAHRMIERLFAPQLPLGRASIGDLIDSNTSLLMARGNKGFISSEIATAIMKMTLFLVFSYCKKREDAETKVVVIIDEFTRSGLCCELVASALAELRKFNCEITLISQDLCFGQWKQVILQNTNRKEWFRSSDQEVLDVAGKDIATRYFDHDRISHTEEYVKRSRKNDDEVNEVDESRDRHMSLNDQIKMAQKEVMTLQVGQRIVTGD